MRTPGEAAPRHAAPTSGEAAPHSAPAAAGGETAPPGPAAPDGESRTAGAGATTPGRSRLRAWLGENPSPHSPPFSRHRWLRLLTYVLTTYAALTLAIGGGAELTDSYRFTTPVALITGFIQGTAVVLALWRPVPAWALSLCGATVAALLVRHNLESIPLGNAPNWPWSTPALLAQMAVLVLLALRVGIRGTVAAFGVTALTTYALEGLVGAQRYSPTGPVAVVLFAVAALLGTVLRSRSEARTQLVRQTTITAEERARRTLLEERSRIARELHDVVAHHMSVISIQAQVAPHLVENPSQELKENLAGIRDNALEALTELRRVLGVLRSEAPGDPDDPGEPAPDAPQPNLSRLDALMENTRAAGLEVGLQVSGKPRPYAPGVELSAYRIVQEALSNALRHAPGSTVSVEVSHFPHGICLDIANSRPRHPVQPSPGSGHGLLGMRERAAMLGGHVTAQRTRNGGFTVTAFLPHDSSPDGDPYASPYPSPSSPPYPSAHPPTTGDQTP
ncbi:sensor histidine kinase [Streptomyces sp. NK08204]|uniref:sensor histidine kinase n=1 Tax=Streptomyces sp. NK08204 TaxID=2873260 RepID=UPI001CED7D81|nr:sensor histidine kinase [Streptomyces sp. NK08204]